MSVAGIDCGNAASCIALARKRGVDVIMNAESKRETPAIVSFGEKMRAVGVEGAARLTMNMKNTVVQVKRLIGRKFNDPEVQKDIKDFMFKVSEAPNGGCLISVMYLNEPKQVTPEQVVATILKDLKGIAEADQGSTISDCVVSVPAFFGESERRAMLTAAELSGLKCLRLMNELTAAALNWGIFKADLPEEQPLHVVFVDVGHSALQVCIAAFKKGSMEIKAHTWDRSLGGRDLDAVLVKHFGEEFKAKTKLDIMENAKARFRMATQVTKTRQMLTTNPEAPISVECLMEDTDFRSEVTREKFEELAAPILEKTMKPCADALLQAGITAADVSAVEMVGAASRTPAIVKTVADVFKQEPKRTMNSKECVSRGCSLQAAMLSPIFQVRHFDVKELYPFKVNIEFEKEGSPTTSQLFGSVVKDGVNTPQFLPCIKNVAFHKTDPFAVKIRYSDDADIGGASREIADFNVTAAHKYPEGATNVSCKVSFELDLHGLVRCTQATHCHKIEVEEAPPAAPAAPKADAAAPADGAAPAAGASTGGENDDASNMETDPPVGPPAPEEAKPVAGKKQKKVSTDAAFKAVFTAEVSSDFKNRLLEEEGQMAAADSLQRATDEAKNALEEYVYALRSKVQGECAAFVKEADAAALVAELNDLENWLYEDGEDEKKSVYESKHAALKAKGEPIIMRYQESQTRDAAVQQLSNKCQQGLQWAQNAPSDPKFAHIDAADLEIVKKECTSALAWLEGKNNAQSALSLFDDPAVLTSELIQQKQTLENVCSPIMNKPVPPPPKPAEPEKKPEEATPMDEDTPPPADGAAAGDAAPMEEA